MTFAGDLILVYKYSYLIWGETAEPAYYAPEGGGLTPATLLRGAF